MIEKLYALMSKVGITKGQDKVLHFVAGFVIVSVLLFFVFEDYISFLVMLFVAIGKEIYDEYNYGSGDFFDFFATLLGGFAGLLMCDIILKLIGGS